MKVRLTIEYDNDEGNNKTTDEEFNAWMLGHINVADVYSLVMNGDKSAKITIEEIKP